MNHFVNPVLTKATIDTYIIRKAIFEALNTNLISFSGKLLDVGCGKMPYKNHILKNSSVLSYHGIDIKDALEYDKDIKPDFYWDGLKLPFKDNSYDCIISTEVLEHVPHTSSFLNEINRVLKSEGVFFFTTPFFWNLHEVPHDQYRFTPFSLERLLVEANFKNIKIVASGSWHESLAQMLGLWIKRSPLPKYIRRLSMPFILILIKYLLTKDRPTDDFSDNKMINSISGIAQTN